jgi:hypothetical protein
LVCGPQYPENVFSSLFSKRQWIETGICCWYRNFLPHSQTTNEKILGSSRTTPQHTQRGTPWHSWRTCSLEG